MPTLRDECRASGRFRLNGHVMAAEAFMVELKC